MSTDTGQERRLAQARELWKQAEGAEVARHFDDAFLFLTAAHDRVTDLPEHHQEAHRRLLPVDRALGRRRDVLVDRLLLLLAPVGSFALLAIYFRLTADYSRFETPERATSDPGGAAA